MRQAPTVSTSSTNRESGSATRKPGMLSSLSSVPPVWPSPRPLTIGTRTPQAATSGARGSEILSPTPPVECLSTLRPGMWERSRTRPERSIASRKWGSSLTPSRPRKNTAMRNAASCSSATSPLAAPSARKRSSSGSSTPPSRFFLIRSYARMRRTLQWEPHAHPLRGRRRRNGARHPLRRSPRRDRQAARRAGRRLGPRPRLPVKEDRTPSRREEDLGAHHRHRGQRGAQFQDAPREPEGRRDRVAREHPGLLRRRRPLPSRRGGERLRDLELSVRGQPRDPGGQRRQHADHQPLPPRRRNLEGARNGFPARKGGGEGEAAGRLPFPGAPFFLPGDPQEKAPPAPADPAS